MGWGSPSAGFASPVPAVSQTILTATITASSTQNTLGAVQTTITPSGGSAYTYAGSLSKPTGSSAALDSATTANPSFTPDKAGTYTVTLTATDTASGATVTKVRTQEVGTSTLSVSIAAVSDSTPLPSSGTVALDSTVSNSLGSVTYAWSGEDPSGTAISFSDATAADPTITYTATQLPGTWSATVTVTDSARAQTASATARWTTGGLPTSTTPRAVLVYVSGDALLWKEQVLFGSHWVDVAGSSGSLTAEVDGGVTFSGTTLTIPSGLATSTAPATDPDSRYVAISSLSATFQAMWVTGAQWIVSMTATSIEQTTNARWGWALAFPTGSFDAGAENAVAVRMGWNGSAYAFNLAGATSSYGTTSSAATVGTPKISAAIATATSGSWYWAAASDKGTFSPTNTAPTHLYLQCSSTGTAAAATTAVVAPQVRLAVFPVTL